MVLRERAAPQFEVIRVIVLEVSPSCGQRSAGHVHPTRVIGLARRGHSLLFFRRAAAAALEGDEERGLDGGVSERPGVPVCSGRSRKGNVNAAEGQGKAVKRKWKAKEKQ